MNTWGGSFDVADKKIELDQLEQRMTTETFWNDNEAAHQVVDKVSILKSVLNPFNDLTAKVEDFVSLAELVEEDGADSPMLDDADEECDSLNKLLDEIELLSFLKGK